MKTAAKRNVVRWFHITIGALVATYIYSPWGDIPLFQWTTKWLVLPLLLLSGLWMWKGHLLKPKHLKGNRVLLLFLALSFSTLMQGQESGSTDVKRFGFELSPVGIGVFSITQFKGTYLVNPQSNFHTEIGFGLMLQPESTAEANASFNADGLYSANMVSFAFRQYFWRGLHFEKVVNMGNARVRNNAIDGQDYTAFVTFSQTFLGYKFNLINREKITLFVIGQGGFGYAYNANPWPSKGGPSIYGLGDLKIGINF